MLVCRGPQVLTIVGIAAGRQGDNWSADVTALVGNVIVVDILGVHSGESREDSEDGVFETHVDGLACNWAVGAELGVVIMCRLLLPCCA